MRRLSVAQRVFVIVDQAGNRIDRAGIVRRLRRSDDGAWVELDERHEACPFPADDATRSRHICAYPEDCRAVTKADVSSGATLDKGERHVMAHATAWDSSNRLYRNHFCAGPGHDDWATLQALCARGLMRASREPSEISGGDTVFLVTRAGIAALEGTS